MRGRVKRMGKFNFFPSLIGLLFVYVATCMAFWWAQASSYMEVKRKRVTRIDGRMGVSAKVEKNGCLIHLQINHISQVLTLKPASALPSIAPLNPIRVCLTRMKNYFRQSGRKRLCKYGEMPKDFSPLAKILADIFVTISLWKTSLSAKWHFSFERKPFCLESLRWVKDQKGKRVSTPTPSHK